MTVADPTVADLPYAPPFWQAIDNVAATAHVLESQLTGRMKGVSCNQVRDRRDSRAGILLLDTRGPDEFELMRLGAGEVLIPLGTLRRRLHELPADKDTEIICFCRISLRGWEAASLLQARGWRNVSVMEGAIMAWPLAREQ